MLDWTDIVVLLLTATVLVVVTTVFIKKVQFFLIYSLLPLIALTRLIKKASYV